MTPAYRGLALGAAGALGAAPRSARLRATHSLTSVSMSLPQVGSYGSATRNASASSYRAESSRVLTCLDGACGFPIGGKCSEPVRADIVRTS